MKNIWSYDHIIKTVVAMIFQQQSPKHQPPNVDVYDSYRNKTHPSNDLIRPNKNSEDLKSQQHLSEASKRAMSIDYCREQGGAGGWKPQYAGLNKGLNHWIQHPLAKPEYHGRIVSLAIHE